MIINDDSSIVNKFGASLTDATGVVIYNRHMFIVQATGPAKFTSLIFINFYQEFVVSA
jgi:hypothetical protein